MATPARSAMSGGDERIAALRRQLDGPRDGALLRFALGRALLDDGDAALAVPEFERAVSFDPAYSAAWQGLGESLAANGQAGAAIAAYERGIAAAEARGDVQAAKVMRVRRRRLEAL
jgi:Tfp pilus assembly protein PilF